MKMDEFYTYVLSFYGKGGLYPMNATLTDVKAATKEYKKHLDAPFEGDSMDREAVRDILIKDFGYTWPVETQGDITMLGKSEQAVAQASRARARAKHMIRWMDERRLGDATRELCIEFAMELARVAAEEQLDE